jgi:hypothetical protein|tara:strand:+ start:693 stop:830 length:138 start_codon:yes stop_codon:yes gene_type:complete
MPLSMNGPYGQDDLAVIVFLIYAIGWLVVIGLVEMVLKVKDDREL